MNPPSPQTLSTTALRSVFVEQLSILYNTKVNLTIRLPELVTLATFRNLKLALTEGLEDNERQMISLKTIFISLDESWLTDKCLGVNALINEAHSQIALHHDKHFESDMSILFYMSVIENLQIGASQMLNLMSSKLPYQQYAQLIRECRDMVKDNSELLFCVADEYLNIN